MGCDNVQDNMGRIVTGVSQVVREEVFSLLPQIRAIALQTPREASTEPESSRHPMTQADESMVSKPGQDQESRPVGHCHQEMDVRDK